MVTDTIHNIHSTSNGRGGMMTGGNVECLFLMKKTKIPFLIMFRI